MSVRVLCVSGMPYGVKVWVDDDLDCFRVYIDEELITEQGAASLEAVFRKHITGWRRLDESFIHRTLRAITG